jgi:hypothetical protein
LSKGPAFGVVVGVDGEAGAAFEAETPVDEAKRAKSASDDVAASDCIFEMTADAKRLDPVLACVALLSRRITCAFASGVDVDGGRRITK